tara:strand:+ start:33294 stop:33824 length:531 start_codon:yes stop_codon:yes gene_type:complete
MKKLEKTAQEILAKNPEQNAVYMTEDGQAFFSKDARNNHAKERKLEVADFFRNGVATDEETADAIKALEVKTEEVAAATAALEIIEKIFTDEEVTPEVTPDTHAVVALAVGVKEQLAEAKEQINLRNERQEEALEEATIKIKTLEVDLSTALADNKKMAEDLKNAQKELAVAKKAK